LDFSVILPSMPSDGGVMSFHSRLKPAPRAATGLTAAAGSATLAERLPPEPTGPAEGALAGFMPCYLDSLAAVERMHRLLLDLIKDEFERLGILNVNAVQALLLYNIADHEVTAGELKSRGYYQGSNVSYNLKKLVEGGLMHHTRCEIDRRSVRVRLTPDGHAVREVVGALFARHARGLLDRGVTDWDELDRINAGLRRVERFWADQIRYIY
jgi:DNA-binding MarR family transcriptional regulator